MTAFYFDRMVATFGQEVEAAMDEASEKTKGTQQAKAARARVLAKHLRNADGTHAPGTFRDPAAR